MWKLLTLRVHVRSVRALPRGRRFAETVRGCPVAVFICLESMLVLALAPPGSGVRRLEAVGSFV